MFVYLPRRGWYGAVALASTLAIGACGPGNQPSALRPDGPPEVLTVDLPAPDPRISTGEEAPGSLIELATFCKTQGPNDGAKGAGDPQRPGVILTGETYDLTVCPADDTMPVQPLTNVDPSTWYVRIQFDELLDPSIEDLVPITDANGNPTGTSMGTLKNTQPVTLQCASSTGQGGMVDIPYDGYYDPSGDSVSYPLGPSLVIQTADPTLVATGSMCQITLKTNIKDKDGNQVPTDQLGPYTWSIGTIAVSAITPMDGSMVDPIAAGVDLTFNAVIDPTSLMPAQPFSPTVPNVGVLPEAPNEVLVYGDFPASSPTYNFGITSVADQCGKTTMLGTPSDMNNTATSFSTNPLMLTGITGATDPGSKIVLAFNQYMDATTLVDGTNFTIAPEPTGGAPAGVTASGPNLIVDGTGVFDANNLVVSAAYKLNTSYTFTLNAGAAIKDCPGGEATCANQSTFTNGAAQVVTFMTDPAITLNNVSPMDSSTITAGTPVDLTFNQTITDASVTAAITAGNITIDPAVTLAEESDGNEDVYIGAGPIDAMGNFAPWPAGTYTLTIKGAASFSDGITGDAAFTPGMDQVIHFTVPPPATGSAPTCF
jgi:hypothetical protein